MLNANELQAGLAHFSGTENWYQFHIGSIVLGLYTDGVQWLAENAECYWLLTEIFTAQVNEALKQEPFQVWTLVVNKDLSAKLTCDDGNGKELFHMSMPWTSFPLETIKLWLEKGDPYAVLLLPREH